MDGRIEIEVRDGVADVMLVREDKLNALDARMFAALAHAGEMLRRRHDVRAIVLGGRGRAFCAGLDLASLAEVTGGGMPGALADKSHGPANFAQHVVWQWRTMPAPVIAAVHGVAFGAGIQLALGADMRMVHPEALFSVMEIKWGLVPDMAGIKLLRDIVRPDIAAEMTYSGRVYSGTEAAALGLATRLCADPREEALQLAREIAGRSPDAVRAAKRLLAIDDDDLTARIFAGEASEQIVLIGSPNQLEAVAAERAKRPPRFRDGGGRDNTKPMGTSDD